VKDVASEQKIIWATYKFVLSSGKMFSPSKRYTNSVNWISSLAYTYLYQFSQTLCPKANISHIISQDLQPHKNSVLYIKCH